MQLTNEQLKALATKIAEAVAKNAGAAPELCLAPALFVLQDAMLPQAQDGQAHCLACAGHGASLDGSRDCAKCHGNGVVDDGFLTHSEGGVEYSHPIKCVKDCPTCKGSGRSSQSQGQALPDAADQLAQVYAAFGIGEQTRTLPTLLTNIQNARRRAECLWAIEREFFTKEVPVEDWLADEPGETHEECPLLWGANRADYVEQFRAALAEHVASQLALPAGPGHDPKNALQFLEQYGKNLEAAGFSSGDALKACRVIFETKVAASPSPAVAQPVADERMRQAIGTLRWILNITEDRLDAPASELLDETFTGDRTTSNRQTLEWLWAYLDPKNSGTALCESPPTVSAADGWQRVIGWRTEDYLHETSDLAMARNWEPNVRVLPIFEGDPNTRLTARPAPGHPAEEGEKS